MKRSITRTRGNRFCTIDVELEERDGVKRLSICGSEGRIVKRGSAKREALDYWTSYFEECPGEIIAMGQRFGRQFRTAKGAARFVLETDGELHGVDVEGPTEGATLRIVESCGQIRDAIVDFFPEAAPYMRWHLNDLRAECEHQEARGETWATHPSAECPDCCYKLGSAWKTRELPAEVVAWAEGLPETMRATDKGAA